MPRMLGGREVAVLNDLARRLPIQCRSAADLQAIIGWEGACSRCGGQPFGVSSDALALREQAPSHGLSSFGAMHTQQPGRYAPFEIIGGVFDRAVDEADMAAVTLKVELSAGRQF